MYVLTHDHWVDITRRAKERSVCTYMTTVVTISFPIFASFFGFSGGEQSRSLGHSWIQGQKILQQ